MSYEISSVELEKLSLYAQQVISKDTLAGAGHSAIIKIVSDNLARFLRIHMRKDLWGKVIDEVHIQYPADWWQALKLRFLPTWLLKRTPVKYIKIDKKLYAVFPDLALSDYRFANVYLYNTNEKLEPTENTLLVLTKKQKYQLLNLLLGYRTLCFTQEEKSLCDSFIKQITGDKNETNYFQ